MRLKKLHFLLLGTICLGCNVASAQLFIDQATFTIQSGATVTVQGDVTSNTDILGTGKVILKGTGNQNINLGGFNVPNLEVDNTSNVTLTGNSRVSGDLLFTNGDIIAGNNTLTIGSTGTITGATSSRFVVTNGTGRLVKAALGATAFNFPIGNSTTSYDPVAIANSGTADNIGARSFANVLTGGATGTAYTKETINNSWDISEAVAGGSILSVTATWNTADELPGFDRNRGGLSNYLTAPAASVGWDLLNTQTGMAVGANPYTYTRSNITTTGIFAVGTRPVLSPLLVSPKIFLQGSYNTTLNVMSDALRLANLIPLTEPYSTTSGSSLITTLLRGSGGGETSPNTVVGSLAAANDNAIVDWVLVQLHRTSDNVVVTQRAVLLQKDGDIVDTDGVSPVNLAGNASGSYFVSIKHRNHLGVRSAASLGLLKVTNTPYNFSTGLAQALAPGSSTAMTNRYGTATTTTNFMLWAGNGNTNGTVRYAGSLNDESVLLNGAPLSGSKVAVLPGYFLTDYNMNGVVRYAGSQNDENILLNISVLGDKVIVVPQAAF